MATIKEVKSKVKSIQSTQQITRAMEMVAASKMRKARERMQASRPYLQRINDVIKHIESGNLEEKHSFLLQRSVKKVGFLVVSSDRGLCGGLNNNIFRLVFSKMQELDTAGIDNVVFTIGAKAENFFTYNKANVQASISDVGDKPGIKDLIGVIAAVLDTYNNNEIDQIYLAYNNFVSTITCEAKLELLLPLTDQNQSQRKSNWDYIYEPAPAVLLDTLLHRYIETVVYQAVVENISCEQAARMVAMKNASENAEELVKDLKLVYNKARQAAITRELSEIVAGAAAV